ncbi:type 4a pilus biogenesis protein PilO [Pseudomonas sp. NW5]|uniref:type 4a pilus biogenesis protein PilO n=1 Tax=Pseudomonas sp. NW5 TaxID=2934934 RepID=UPI0020225696|nr:type 4a pilus biogenesis protein PilO [Pseudomonas sp. NW5]MCL7461804.1 type 4a pilus biogenesis protein PilO [Pseudomonas sp. NW5]
MKLRPETWRSSPEHWPLPAQLLAALLLGSLLVLGVGAFWLEDALARWQLDQQTDAELRQQVAVLQAQGTDLERWRAHHRRLRVQLEGLQQPLPEENALPALLATLEQQAEAHGLQLRKVQVLESSGTERCPGQPLQVQLRGEYHALGRVLVALAEPALGLHATALSLQPAADAAPQLDIQLQLLSQQRCAEVL